MAGKGGKREGAGSKKGVVPDAVKEARKDIADMMRPHTTKAVEAIIRCLSSEKEAVVLSAAEKILERVYGRAPQPITGADGGAVKFQNIDVNDPEKIARRIKELLS